MAYLPNHPLRITSLIRSYIAAGVKIKTPPIKGGSISMGGSNHQLAVTRKG